MALITVDQSTFDAAYYKGWSEKDFINDQLSSVPDKYGYEKREFLKKVYDLMNPAQADVKVAVKKK